MRVQFYHMVMELQENTNKTIKHKDKGADI